MKRFVQLFEALDQTTKTKAKVSALADYFQEAPSSDKLWAIALLSHKRPKRSVTMTLLRTWAAEEGNLPLWLFEESYHIVGDLAEAIALVLPRPEKTSDKSLTEWIELLIDLGNKNDDEKKAIITDAWAGMDHRERFIFNKIITGGFRVGVSSKLVTRALAIVTNIEENVIMHRLMGNWTPQSISFENLVLEKQGDEDLSRPYPFYLAYALDSEFDQLGSLDHWQAEYKWDGIRAQLIHRQGQVFLWSRGEELISQRFPEFEQASQYLPDGTVLDGELVLFAGDVPMSFQHLQTRIGRKNVTKKILETMPAAMICYDLLEDKGEDIRSLVLKDRRNRLEKIISHQPGNVLKLSPTIDFHTWSELDLLRQQARNRNAEGIMLKHRDSKYQSGRKRGDWWKWKIDPLTIDAVLLYAQQGHGRRANLFTDYTFAVWSGDDLVPFTKAYSGLTDAEFQEITRYVRANTLDRYGPVRAVVPNLVFEIAFEGIQASSRHKSGVALRFPRMLRWRKDKHPKEANTLEDLKAILKQYG